MKNVIAMLLVLFSVTAQAESFDIFEASYDGSYPRVSPRFSVNRELGRAWVEINVDTSSGDSSFGNDDYRQQVAGLRYDSETKSILLVRDGREVECARWKRSGVFGLASHFKMTGCSFAHRLTTRSVDDGFNVRKESRVIVSLKILE